MATRLILIRHAQTDSNLERKYSGISDVSLNKNGRNQARKLCERLKNRKIHCVYVSDRKRAIQSARIIFKGLMFKKVRDLRELNFGIFEGLNYKEIMDRYSQIYREWLDDPFGVAIPKSEDLQAFQKRVIKAIEKITFINKGKTIAVVSHGGSISVFINYVLKSKDFWGKIPASASISIVEYVAGKAKVKLFNDIKHLDG